MKKQSILLVLLSVSILNSYAQNVGIGTNDPKARLHVTDSNVVFTGSGFPPPSPGNAPVNGFGRRMMWYADKAAFRTGFVTGDEWDNVNTGNYSFAAGFNAQASGEAAVALVRDAVASGVNSVAIGDISGAEGNNAVAIGYSASGIGDNSMSLGYRSNASALYSHSFGNRATAVGESSMAIGFNSYAQSFAEIAMGSFNANYLPFSTSAWNLNDRLFTIGNGTSASVRSNALTVLKNGNIGIGTNIPAARLHVLDSSVAFSSNSAALASPNFPPVSGFGKRMMWYADKAAFRVGFVNGNEWDKDNVGYYSFATGHSPTASGHYSIAMGNQAQALASHSVSLGTSTTAFSNNEIVMGIYNTEYTPASVEFWNPNDRLFVIGNGTGTTTRSNALTIYKNAAVELGGYVNNYLRIGLNASGPDFAGMMLGHGVSGKQADAGKFQYGGFGGPTHVLNIVGGGTNAGGSDRVIKLWSEGGMRIRGNALPDADNLYTLGQSGNRWSAVWVASGVIQTSDIRLKTNISSLNYGLKELMQLQPVQYNWKTAPADKKEIGFLAQEIQKLIPEAVEDPGNGDALGMKYNQLIPVLVKAIQEQQQLINEQKKEMDELKNKLSKLDNK